MKKVKVFKVTFTTERHDGSSQKLVYKDWDEYKAKATDITPPNPSVCVVAEDIVSASQYACEHFDEIASEFDQRFRFFTGIESVVEMYPEVLC